ncbi:MAG TPA: bifunctional diaminohydroxyphosphoribosylaminopyrimidine deaminase/5-amino-6-(5-phosphoribosylamino)uracil reductase RibD, partial [Dongiaceae bacterium]|nr:bifunctional diaminohydroxyphosphoribosylaminopyrimidine deaminase/5-amino-6-(5-phosphoribosylamino)uracil reductase RibD [Dongiaceae bacterium]
MFTRSDQRHLRRALTLARRGAGRVSPNPMVGAVVVRGGRVVGEGWHTRPGAPHAEVVALERAGGRARGARLYVNLEPCRHHGRTPPCTDAIIAAGVAEVIACLRDPDPRVNGAGFRALRAAGIRVRTGLCGEEAERVNAAFLTRHRTGRPRVTLKAGMSLDGRIATR